MQYEELSQYWKEKVAEYIKEKFNEDRKKLGASDFKHNIMLHLHDGSYVYFNFAFYILNEDKTKIAVFTEHCGYHIFPFYGAEVKLLSLESWNAGEKD